MSFGTFPDKSPLRKVHFLIFLTAVLFVSGHTFGQTFDTIIIDHVNVIPMTSEEVLKDQRVLIAEGKIVRIEDASAPDRNTLSRRIESRGKFLIPGLSEMHYHFRSNDINSDLKLLVANGVTTVRNMASPPDATHIEIRRKAASGELLPVNYFTTGPYLTNKDITSKMHVEELVKMHRDKGYDFIKLADNFPLDIYLRLLQLAVEYQLPVVGHSQRNQPVEYSLRMKAIEHVEEFLYLSDSAGHPAFFKRNDAEIARLVQQIKTSGVYIGTTLAVFEFINKCLSDSAFKGLQLHPHVKYLARDQREAFLTEKNDYRKLRKAVFDGVAAPKLFSDYFVWMRKFVKLLDEANVPLLTGSDTYGMVIVGFSLHEEFRLLQETGIKPIRILQASTVNSARFLNQYSTEGTIAPGKNANLVLLNKNPLDDIRNIKSIEGVFLKGEWLSRSRLDRMLEEVNTAFK